MRSGLIVNPSSARSGRKGLALAAMLQGQSAVPVYILHEFDDLHDSLQSLAKDGVTDLFISSGDGTVHAIQTILAEASPFARPPRLGLLPHGTTNMTAADLGIRRRSVAAQADLLLSALPRRTQSRHTLRVVNPRDGRPRHGMFIGTGAVWRAVAFCQEAVHRTGLKGEMASFATLAAAVGRALMGRSRADDATRIDRAYPMTVTSNGRTFADGGQLLFLATTLKKLILGTKPFWGGGPDPLRASILPYPVPSLMRWILPIMYGGEARRTPPGAVSFSCRALEIRTAASFVIDGEFFDPPENEPLRIELGPAFDYIRD